MTKLTFYRQGRKDGGIRTGVEIDDDSVLGCFERGPKKVDSALLWFVDIRCSLNEPISDPEEAREWLLKNAAPIQKALGKLAAELSVGMDFAPLDRPVANMPRGTQSKIVCSAMRRVTAQQMAHFLTELKTRWPELIGALPTLEPAMA